MIEQSRQASQRLARDRPRAAVAAVLAMIVLVSTLLRIAANANAPGPWIFVDELIYSELGRSVFSGPAIRGVPSSGYGFGYPLVIAPAYALFENLVAAFTAVKVVNAFVMSLVAIPVYVTARVIMSRRWAIVAAALSVAVPAMAYTSVVMTESAFYPAFALAVMLMVLALRRPTVIRQVLVWPAIILCFEIRSQGAILALVFVAAVALVAVVDGVDTGVGSRSAAIARSFFRFWPTLAVLVVGAGGGLAYLMQSGRTLGSLLGAYSIAAEATDRYQIRPIVSWFFLHISELSLWLGVVPFAAALVLAGTACTRSASRDVRVFAIVGVLTILGMTAVVAAFVVFANVGRIEERNLFYVGIIPLIALCWWVATGLRRSDRWFPLVLVAAAGLPLAIPYAGLLNQTATSDTFGLFIPWALSIRLFDPNLTVFAVAFGTIAVAAVVLYLPVRRSWALVILVAAWFAVTALAVDTKADRAAQGAVAQGISGPRDWVDRAVGADSDVAVVYPGSLEPLKVWQNEFFNRSVGRVMTVSVPLPGSLPDEVVYPRERGLLYDVDGHQVDAPFVLAHDSTTVAGSVIAEDRPSHMVLVRAENPLRLVDTVSGIFDDGWTGPEVVFTVYECSGGTVTTTARLDGYLHAAPVTVTPSVAGAPGQAVSVAVDGTPSSISVPVQPVDGVCEVRFVVDPTAVPAEVGVVPGDPRPLGVLMTRPVYTPD